MGCLFLLTIKTTHYKLVWRVRHHSHLPSSFNGSGDFSLVMAAQPRFFTGFYFIKTGHVTHHHFRVFIINVVYVFLAKIANHTLDISLAMRDDIS